MARRFLLCLALRAATTAAAPALPDDECGASGDGGACAFHALQRRAAVEPRSVQLQQRGAERRSEEPPAAEPRPALRADAQAHASEWLRGQGVRIAGAAAPGEDDAADADGEAGGGPDLIGLAVAMTLRRQLDAINLHIQESIPDTIQEVYSSVTNTTGCCMPGFWSCLCHCTAFGRVEFTNLTNAKRLRLVEVLNVSTDTTTLGQLSLRAYVNVSAPELSGKGVARSELNACAKHLTHLSGGAGLTVSATGIARLDGVLVPKGDKMCFTCERVGLTIPVQGVTFLDSNVEVGGWRVFDLSGSFWDSAIHALPTQGLVDSLASAADEAIPEALNRESLCF